MEATTMAPSAPPYMDLSALCARLSGANMTDPSSDWERQSPALGEFLWSSNTSAVSAQQDRLHKVSRILARFESFTEWYVLTSVAGLGVLTNVTMLMLLCRDRASRTLSAVLQSLVVLAESAYLLSVLVYVQYRHVVTPADVRALSIITTAMSVSQTLAVWMLYVTATDAYRALKSHHKPAKLRQLVLAPRNAVLVVLLVLAFHVPYVPEVRVQIYHLDPGGFDPCVVPVQEHWDFKTPSGDYDLYYILYYSVLYSLVLYWVPFVLLASRNKDIIDTIHATMGHDSPWCCKNDVLGACYTGRLVSFYCNVNLVCVTPKLVLLLFQLTDYAARFLGKAQVFFEFFNVLANLMLVLKASLYFFTFVIFHPSLKMIACSRCARVKCCKKQTTQCCPHRQAFDKKRHNDTTIIPMVKLIEPTNGY